MMGSERHHAQQRRAHQPNIWPSSSFCFMSSSSGTTFSFALRPTARAKPVDSSCINSYTATRQRNGLAVQHG